MQRGDDPDTANSRIEFPENATFLPEKYKPKTSTLGDSRRGEKLFKQFCAHCHGLSKLDDEKPGPWLTGILGSKAGVRPGYKYSAAMKNSHVRWDLESLNSFLWDPGAFIPGTKMEFRGFTRKEDRRDILAYLYNK